MPSSEPIVIAGRYVIEAQLGRGGTATVSRVFDRNTGEHVALKQLSLHGSPAVVARMRTLFERECLTLSLLNHPRIVRVLDHGLNDDVPYYTMELLGGGELLELAPLPWKRACEIGRDVCSALSLLHARRMVYRDLTPRNVRCSSDGMAKLIDFGALALMGSAEPLVCTPAVAAPELVHLQPLDGRTDLYALGATLYFTLTGRMPYPTNDFRMLPQLWAEPLTAPAALVPGIPEALDGLVMEMLSREPQQRPASAAEVSERLCAIAGVRHDDTLVASQAYLSTPELAGREAELGAVQRQLEQLRSARRGCALMFVADAGQGRSRLLDASVFLAKLAGVAVLRIRSDDGASSRIAAVQRFAEQLLRCVPDAASCIPDDARPVLSLLVGELGGASSVSAADALAQALPAMRAWLLAVCDLHPLLMEVDDIERLNVETRNLIALLADRAQAHPLLIVVARCAGLALRCEALRLLESLSVKLEVQPLSLAETHTLLDGMFGQVPHVSALAQRLYALTRGNPRRLMQLAQHLVDQGVIRHQRAAWTLPEDVTDIALPDSLAKVYDAIVEGLSEPARSLAAALALAGVDQHLGVSELLRLSGLQVSRAAARDAAVSDVLLATLSELTTSSVLSVAGADYRLAGPEWIEPLLLRLATDRERELREELAKIFAQAGDGPREAFQLMRAGHDLLAVDALARFADLSCARTDPDPAQYQRFIEEVPSNWREIYREILARASAHPRRRYVECAIRVRLAGILALASGPTDGRTDVELEALTHTLAQDAGLDLLDPALAPRAGVYNAIGLALERHRARPEAERVYEPELAIKQLARVLIAASGYVVNSFDFDAWRRLPAFRPLAALSAELDVIQTFLEAANERFAARYGASRRKFLNMLEQLPPPHEVSVSQTYLNGLRVGAATSLALYAALLGNREYERWAQSVASVHVYTTNTLLVRALGALWLGDVRESDRLESERRIRRLEDRRPQNYEGLGAIWRLMGYAACEDLSRTRLVLDEIESFAAQSPTWESAAIWARAEYERIRGDRSAALAHADEALQRIAPGHHILWSSVATTRLLTLTAMGRQAEALLDGERYLEAAAQAGLDHVRASLHNATALAAAKHGVAAAANRHIEAALSLLTEHGAGGIRLGMAFEAAASAAIYLHDREAFERYEPRCRELYCAHDNRPLIAKYQRLVRAATRAGVRAATSVQPGLRSQQDPALGTLEAALQSSSDPHEAIARTLELIAAEALARAGYVFALAGSDPVLLTQVGDEPCTDELWHNASLLLTAARVTDDDATRCDDGMSAQSLLIGHLSHGQFVLHAVAILRGATNIPTSATQLARRLSRYLESVSFRAV